MKLSFLSPFALILTALPTLPNPASTDKTNPSQSTATTEFEQESVGTPKANRSPEKPRLGIWSIFSSTFLTIFLAEMGDKTQLATLLISAESQSPWIVFAGAALALVTTSLLGVLIGRWLSKRLSPKALETAAGTLLLFISVMLLWDVVHL